MNDASSPINDPAVHTDESHRRRHAPEFHCTDLDSCSYQKPRGCGLERHVFMRPKSCWASNEKYRGGATLHHGYRTRGEGRSTATVSLFTLFQRIDQTGCKHALDSLIAITATSRRTHLPVSPTQRFPNARASLIAINCRTPHSEHSLASHFT